MRKSSRRLWTAAVVVALGMTLIPAVPAGATSPGAVGKLVYDRWEPSKRVWQLYVANADGTNPRRINESDHRHRPRWSPDGRRISFLSWGTLITIVDADGRNRVHVPARPTGEIDSAPTWSAGGKRFAWSTWQGENDDSSLSSSIWSHAVDGSGGTDRLVDGSDPVWSPSGSRLAYEDRGAVRSVSVSGSGTVGDHTVLYQGSFPVSHPDWKPDGARISFTEWTRTACRQGQGDTFFRPQVVHAKPGGGDRRVVACGDAASWSPDGRELVYVGTDGAYAVRADGTNRRRLVKGQVVTAAWQPVPVSTTVTASASRTSLTYGTSTTVSGRLLRAGTSTGIPSRPVALQVRRAGASKWTQVATGVTRTNGVYSFTHTPAWNAEYRVRHVASNGWPASHSATRAVQVATRVTAALSASSIARGESARVTGAVVPNHAGQRVLLEQLVSGSWERIGSATLSSASEYSLKVTPPGKGTFTYRVTHPGHDDHKVGRSPQLTLEVR